MAKWLHPEVENHVYAVVGVVHYEEPVTFIVCETRDIAEAYRDNLDPQQIEWYDRVVIDELPIITKAAFDNNVEV